MHENHNVRAKAIVNKNEHTQVPLLDTCRSAPFMNDIAVSKDGVIKLLKCLNPSKALGSDKLVVPYCSCCLCLYFGSSIMLVTYFVNFR